MRGIFHRVGTGGSAIILLLLLAPLALGSELKAIHAEVRMETLTLPDPSQVVSNEFLLRVALGTDYVPSNPFFTFSGGHVVVRQYWQNSTVARDPISGIEYTRWKDFAGHKDLPIQLRDLYLERPLDQPDLRLHLLGMAPSTFVDARGVELTTVRPLAGLEVPRATTATELGVFNEFETVPDASGWLRLAPDGVSVSGQMGMLIDGWRVRLANVDQEQVIETGVRIRADPLSGLSDDVQGVVVKEEYTFLALYFLDGQGTFASQGFRLEGYVTTPQVRWEGTASVDVLGGDLDVGGQKVGLTQNRIALAGVFNGDATFPADATVEGAPFRATGRGTTSAFMRIDPGLSVALPQQASLWSSVVVGLGMMAFLVLQTLRSPRGAGAARAAPAAAATDPPAPERMGLKDLQDYVQQQPLDGRAQFQLGIRLFGLGEPLSGLKYLDRSFRLRPDTILQLLEDPQYAPIRDRDEVRRLLGRIQREHHRRIWSGYA